MALSKPEPPVAGTRPRAGATKGDTGLLDLNLGGAVSDDGLFNEIYAAL
jgi:hypothetical protein